MDSHVATSAGDAIAITCSSRGPCPTRPGAVWEVLLAAGLNVRGAVRVCVNACVCSVDVPCQMRIIIRSNEIPATSRLYTQEDMIRQQMHESHEGRNTNQCSRCL